MAGWALQFYIGDFFFLGQNPGFRLKSRKKRNVTKSDVALCVPSYGHRTGAIKWRVLEHAVGAKNRLRFSAIMGLPPSGTARSPGYTFLQTSFMKALRGV